MSCAPEVVIAVYVDGELGSEDLRRFEAHLIGCERCRRRVMALREEARLLRDALHERSPVAEPEPAAEGSVRGMLVGLPLSLVVAGAVAAVAGAILETRLPRGASWLSPSQLLGVNDMIFDLVFTVRDRAPGLLEFGVAIAATASLAAAVTFLAGALLRRVSGPVAWTLPLLALCAVPPPARAGLDVRADETVRIEAGETLRGTLVVSADTTRIDGVVEGNVLALTERLAIHGVVKGSVFSFAREVEISGRVDGNVLSGSDHVRVTGEVGQSLAAGCERFSLDAGARIEGDLAAFADSFVLEGRVGRDVLGFLDRAELRGTVVRDVVLAADRVAVVRGAEIGGDLRARVEDLAHVEIDPAAVIAGETETELVEHRHPSPLARYAAGGFYLWLVVRLAAAFAVGLALHAVFPRLFGGALGSGEAFFGALGRGFAVVLLAPLLLALLALTLVGLPAALLGFALYLAVLYVAGIRVAALVGTALTKRAGPGLRDFGIALLAGLAVVTVAMNLPFLGVLVRIVVVLVGVGLLFAQAREAWRRRALSPPGI